MTSEQGCIIMHDRNCLECKGKFRVTSHSKQQFCSRNCDYWFTKKHGSVEAFTKRKKENQRMTLLTVPKDDRINLRRYNAV